MLKLCATPQPSSGVEALSRLPGLAEVLVETAPLSRLGRAEGPDARNLMAKTKAMGLKTVLVWDLPADDGRIADGAAFLRTLDPALVDAVRVQDPGVALYVKRAFPHMALHLVLETGNHNLEGIRTWIRNFEPRRVVLSNELPLSVVARMRPAVAAEIELLALGRLLLFYSPRKLISAPNPREEPPPLLEKYATSLADGKHFPLVENSRGTSMFYEKDLFLIPYLKDMAAAGVDCARLELKDYEATELMGALAAYLQDPQADRLAALKDCLPAKLTRGFFKSNRTDKQFRKLKNPNLIVREDLTYLGTVVETCKGRYLALMTEAPVTRGRTLLFTPPEGGVVREPLRWIRKPTGPPRETEAPPGLWLINPVPRMSSGTRVYLADEEPPGAGIKAVRE